VRPGPDVEVVELEPGDLVAAGALIARVWGVPDGRGFIDIHTFRAYLLAGEPLLGAFVPGRAHDPTALLGASIGFVGTHPGGMHIHSHVTGVEPTHQHRGVGAALKLAQRDWALARGITEVRWTFDPLVARNAFFNLTKLGARGVTYHVNVYGEMPDATNAGDESDRVEAVWDLTEPVGRPEPDLDALMTAGAAVILSLDGEVWPEARLVPVLLACVPSDIVVVRHADPAAGQRWRRAARAAIGRALDLGYAATGATRDGWWVLEAGPGAHRNEAE
jgi:predicted GNAT superfamily acetyltransferase